MPAYWHRPREEGGGRREEGGGRGRREEGGGGGGGGGGRGRREEGGGRGRREGWKRNIRGEKIGNTPYTLAELALRSSSLMPLMFAAPNLAKSAYFPIFA